VLFRSKYVVVDSNSLKQIRWEEGLNRIADLKLMIHEQSNSFLKIGKIEYS
jgi:hypothetical protein